MIAIAATQNKHNVIDSKSQLTFEQFLEFCSKDRHYELSDGRVVDTSPELDLTAAQILNI
ncbi:MAG: hypothetical protein DCF19_16970 [Pseudanabaena frigida]|uniref:Uma2 family endonuclease n=1 Tax=Pseudanabaena frigida TaxID=945775 RepID=A0A2W4W0U0_9CYAN|nr:MAG: hypothetical protein DCF19_16970 [Pseudanabaena frigida]